MAAGSPFANYLIIGPTCFFLGILFAMFPYDYYVLWASPPAGSGTPGDPDGLGFYFALLESHLKFMHASPPLISRILHIAIGTGLTGIFIKLYKPSEANMLFDGATLVLYVCAITVYVANILKGLRMVSAGAYGDALAATADAAYSAEEEPIGREDSLRVLAASNTILALLLVGILVLQSGQWYAQKKEAAEIAEMDRVAEDRRRAAAAAAGADAAAAASAGDAVKPKSPAREGKKRQ